MSIIIQKIIEGEYKGKYEARWDSISGTGLTHMEALKSLHYMMNFLDGTIEAPSGLPAEELVFKDTCADEKCRCVTLKTK